MAAGSLRAAVLMCHAPIVIPALGRRDALRCRATTEAMAKAAERLVACGAQRVVVLSPHAPRDPRSYGCYAGTELEGDFGRFGEPDLGAVFQADLAAPAAVAEVAARAGLKVVPIHGGLDHGALVPLWFLQAAGYAGRVSVFGFPWNPAPEDHENFGSALREALDDLGSPWALLASGDCSHRLIPGAPSGYDPRAQDFDRQLAQGVRDGRDAGLTKELAALRELAGEDVLDSMEIAAAAIRGEPSGRELLSYEGPFGVGYLVAVLQEARG
jgi:aromatic ring-opening dioxygenase LigB subunit